VLVVLKHHDFVMTNGAHRSLSVRIMGEIRYTVPHVRCLVAAKDGNVDSGGRSQDPLENFVVMMPLLVVDVGVVVVYQGWPTG